MQRQILHVDVNNAFLSWTALYKLNMGETLDIRTIPSVIGGDETRRAGIVLAKSPLAKACGVVTGETLYQARLKCPNLEVFPPVHGIYKEYSKELYHLLLNYTDKIERFSIDECFLDMTDYLMGANLLDVAYEINERVKNELGFTVNVGVAHNKLLAKMASDFEKPDKVHTLFEDEIEKKIWPLPTSELFMLGKKTVPVLYNMRIKTIGDLARTDVNVLIKKFGKFGKMMWEYANGIDESEVNYIVGPSKSIGNSTTLPMDVTNIEKLYEVLFKLTENVTYRLRKEKLIAGTVSVQIRTNKFEDSSHQGKLLNPTSNTMEIYEKAKELLKEFYKKGTYVRLVGVRVDNLISSDEKQITFFEEEKDKKHEKIDKALDELKDKYGFNSVTRGRGIN